MGKKFFYIVFFLLMFTKKYTIAQQVQFSKKFFESAYAVGGNGLVITPDKGYLIAGYIDDKALLIKIDSTGDTTWSAAYQIGNTVKFNDIIFTHDSNIVVVGTTNLSTIASDVLVMKIALNGDTIWNKCIDYAPKDRGFSIQETFDHGFILTGDILQSTLPQSEMLVAKIDSLGNLEWATSIILGNEGNHGIAVQQTNDSSYVIAGTKEISVSPFVSAVVIKLSPQGTVVWSNEYNTTGFYPFTEADVLVEDNGIISYMSGSSDVAIIKTDFQGNLVWSKFYLNGVSLYNGAGISPKVHATADGGYIFTNGAETGGFLAWSSQLYKVDSIGDLVWIRTLFQSAIEALQTSDTGFIILGSGPFMPVEPHSSGGVIEPQFAVIKTDSSGNEIMCVQPYQLPASTATLSANALSPTQLFGGTSLSVFPTRNPTVITVHNGCVDFGSGGYEEFAENLFTISPNPASEHLLIQKNQNSEFLNPQENFSIEIYDVWGKKIYLSKFKHEITIDINSFLKGIYIIRLYSDKTFFVQKQIFE